MRKQTKLVAVTAAAALLAIGASMTSFAATGWVEEDGTWYFYDNDGNRVEDEWKKSGDNWYWLDSEESGAMATDKLIEDDDDTYYVDSTGVMVKNTWVKVVNEDQDDDEDPAEYHYYYMQNNGKAYKNGDASTIKKKVIDGKTYAFDDEGIMVYGWVDASGDRLTGDDGWAEGAGDADAHTYYFGSWEDGSMKTGWQKITVYDDTDGKEDDYDYWFNFKSNGRVRKMDDEWKSNGKYYRFDDRGVMVYQWSMTNASDSNASTSNWAYFNSPEDGARLTKGWFKVVAPNEDNTFVESDDDTFAVGDADEENERWYYADGDGKIASGEIKKIKGKYYGFWPEGTDKAGAMLKGLCALKVAEDGSISKVIKWDMDADDLDDCMDNEGDFENKMVDGASLYYFGDEDTDGSLHTGNVNLNLDGDSYTFTFSKTGGAEGRGKGLTGVDDGKYIYKFGKRMKADSDEKYIVVKASNTTTGASNDTGSDGVVVEEIDAADLRKKAQPAGRNKDGDTVRFVGQENTAWDTDYYLVNTAGSIQGDKTAAKDGDDWYFYTNDDQIYMYTNNKTLKGNDEYTMTVDLDGWKKWTPTNTTDPLS
ncbi:MAG: hypothetical protein PHV18_09225 [Lachnospiraceae bacterium]|nr:hypothetical protein [Lachnospiraceae bacterium]